MAKDKGRASIFQDPDEHITADLDPEAIAPQSDPGSGSDSSEDEKAGTEHYVSVGKSKLRQREGVSLGPDYRGSRVSRAALEEDSKSESEDNDAQQDGNGESSDDTEYDDPETADVAADGAQASDSEIDSDNALAESDAERFNGFSFRGSSKPAKAKVKASSRATAADFMSSSSEEDDDDSDGAEVDEDDGSGVELDGSDEEDETEDGLDGPPRSGGESDDSEEAGEEEEDEEDEEEQEQQGAGNSDEEVASERGSDRAGIKSHDTGPLTAALSNRADVDKGTAIQQQRKIYDGLLNLRIRLQKALVAANTLPKMETRPETGSEPYEAAQEAAIKLLNTISSLRGNVGGSIKSGGKRKRELAAPMPSEEIWEQIQEEDLQSVKFRQDRLEKWARKVQTVSLTTPGGLGQRKQTLVDALEEQLGHAESRLLKRTRVPRSCAPVQAADKVAEDEHVYDDADFYQLLLKELVGQRTVETAAAQTTAVPTVMLRAAKEAKTRKQVDRKASKGRKMRFTVHEKLQNLMAPEDRRSWEQDAIDRFFGTLFGRKLELDEDEDMEDVDAEEEGLRLFRN